MGLFDRKGRRTVFVGGEYFGSHPAIKGYFKPLYIEVSEDGVNIVHEKRPIHHFAWPEIIGYEHEQDTQREGRSRLTVTRMVTLGVGSLAAPKATGNIESKFYCILHTNSGDVRLENEISGSAGSALINMTINVIKKNSDSVRKLVAEHVSRG